MGTKIKKIQIDWTEIKNQCRHTSNKEDTDTPATREFIKKSDVSDDYVNKQMQIVNNKINLSSYFMDTNYYNIVSNYVKWLVKIL